MTLKRKEKTVFIKLGILELGTYCDMHDQKLDRHKHHLFKGKRYYLSNCPYVSRSETQINFLLTS